MRSTTHNVITVIRTMVTARAIIAFAMIMTGLVSSVSMIANLPDGDVKNVP